MKYLLLLFAFMLAGCNSLDAVDAASRVIEPLSNVVNYDTNGYGYGGPRNKPHQKICEVRTGPNSWAWKPCK